MPNVTHSKKSIGGGGNYYVLGHLYQHTNAVERDQSRQSFLKGFGAYLYSKSSSSNQKQLPNSNAKAQSAEGNGLQMCQGKRANALLKPGYTFSRYTLLNQNAPSMGIPYPDGIWWSE